jgi:proteasome accessory factor B
MGVDRRAALRDLKLLAEHVSIRSTGEGRDRRWILDPSRQVRSLGVIDRIALELGRETTRFLAGSGLHDGLDRIAPDRLTAMPLKFRNNLERKIRTQPEPHRQYGTHREVIEEVLDGLLRERLLSLTYRRADSQERQHDALMPLTLVLYRRGLYIIVRRPADGRTFTLAIERIRDVRIGDPFTYPDDWRPDTVLGERFGLASGGPSSRVVLRFAAQAAILVHARVWHRSQIIRDLDDGRVELEMHTAGRELLRLVLEWGPLCEVIEPEALRAEVAENVRQTAAIYQDDEHSPQ